MALWALAFAAMFSGGCTACSTASATGYEHLNERIEAQLAAVGLGPGDVFKVHVYGEKELTGLYRVDTSGAIRFPLVGQVVVGGRTPNEVAEVIAQRLQQFACFATHA